MHANLIFAWCWILTGLLSGAVTGLFFHREQWLGGYDSWPRRMIRLAHIAFMGTGLINMLAAMSVKIWADNSPVPLLRITSIALIVGSVSMSSVCYLAAWKKPLRHLFFIPVTALIIGVAGIIILLSLV